MRDKLEELYTALKQEEALKDICIRSFERPESLDDEETSIVLLPVGPPMQAVAGSDTHLAKTFLYQVNVEAKDRKTCKELQRVVEKVFEKEGFYQTVGGLDDWIGDIKRYVDARTYKGRSALYEDY